MAPLKFSLPPSLSLSFVFSNEPLNNLNLPLSGFPILRFFETFFCSSKRCFYSSRIFFESNFPCLKRPPKFYLFNLVENLFPVPIFRFDSNEVTEVGFFLKTSFICVFVPLLHLTLLSKTLQFNHERALFFEVVLPSNREVSVI